MFADYNALRSAIINWADNDDVAARVDDFIALIHTRLNRRLRLENMTVLATISTTPTSPWVVKPDGYLGMRRLKLDDDRGTALTYKPLTELDEVTRYNQAGRPEVYSILGKRIRLGPIPNGEFVLETAYFKQQPTLTATVTTNVFLEEASDLLLYGALVEAEPYLKDNEMFGLWEKQLMQGLKDIDTLTEAERFPSGDMQMRAV